MQHLKTLLRCSKKKKKKIKTAQYTYVHITHLTPLFPKSDQNMGISTKF